MATQQDPMDILKKERAVVRRFFTKHANELETALQKQEAMAEDPEARVLHKKLKETEEQLQHLNLKVKNNILSTNFEEKTLETELEGTDIYHSKWLRINEMFNSKGKIQECPIPTKVDYKSRNLRLPKLELQIFDGEIKNWLSFWGQFSKIDKDVEFNDIDKFQFLRQSMQPNSEVKHLVESFPPSAYKECIEQLKARYAKEELLVQIYVRELLSIVLNKNMYQKISTLYDKLSTQLRALESLGVTNDKYAAFLLPMVESALPQDLLKIWERCRQENKETTTGLASILSFLKREVESEQRIEIATKLFTEEPKETKEILKRESTASALVAGVHSIEKTVVCIWCEKKHSSVECYKISKMTLDQRKDHLKKKNACMICLKIGHHAKNCKSFVKCFICLKKHSVVLCPGQENKGKIREDAAAITNNNFTSQRSSTTLLQTAMVKIVNGNKELTVRALIDNGSQRSYIKRDVAQKLGIRSAGKEVLRHTLFSGVQVKSKEHNVYNISVKSCCDQSFSLNMTALEQTIICNNLPRYNNCDVSLNSLLAKHNIVLTDKGEDNASEISLLIGADCSGFIMTNTMVVLKDGLIAIKTKLGWVLQGKVNNMMDNMTNTLFCSSDVTGYWSLELLGIRDPVEHKTKLQAEADAVMSFEDNITINAEGRYEVSLPLKVGHEELLSNRSLAEKRLVSTTKRLENSGKFSEYNNIINSWESEGIVEKIPEHEIKQTAHYLPHRGVIKEASMTTKLRPIYDASACDSNGRSLNSYLNTGVNFLDKIPNLLTGFRKGTIGISADIAKAFLQVSITPTDRDYLRFLWWNEDKTSIVEYRHCRVVFGLTSSPFLLSATISYHLKQVTGKEQETAKTLAKSFYVDNCLTSLDTQEDTNKFMSEAKAVMTQAKFNLRQWVASPMGINETGSKVISVLGLLWDTETDELCCNLGNLPAYSALGKISKRDLMSLIQRIFDPVGFTCPATLTPRLIMQETWRRGLTWEDNLPEDLEGDFRKWYKHINFLKECKIPRRLTGDLISECTLSLHLFCDASKLAYGACVLLRSEKAGKVTIQMFSAKARVAPPEKASIPKLELTAALIGSRLLAEARKSLSIDEIKEYCWTDSCVAFYWITRNLPWNVYVFNRVKEVRDNTKASDWRHIPGTLNWADVASRGCTAEQLLTLRWWEGPAWLQLSQEEWPKSSIHVDDTEACKELRKTNTACNTSISIKEGLESLCYFSKYTKIIRMMAWILRFKNNIRTTEIKIRGEITGKEYEEAEKKIIKLIQTSKEEYINEQRKSLSTYHDDEGLLRVKTKLLLSDFPEATKFPILLPAKHIIVKRLVEQRHKELQHAGANQLTADIRTRFWIIGIRRLAKSVIAMCTVCTRFRSKPVQAPTAPLPRERIECTAPFQVSGVDLAGPLFLRSGEKCWVVLYTCAVYRGVHLELTKTLSTEGFMLTLRRFIARRGRIQQIICDNGGNFHGTKNRLTDIDWDEVQKRSTIERIKWKMNAPTAAWWGGFFERLIRIMKDLLKRILGQSRVDYEELETILCECEAVMNQRPLTYVQDDKNTYLEPLTPSCFMQSIPHTDVTDLDAADAKTLNSRLKYLLKLREDFKQRFKNEYLTELVQRGKEKKTNLNIGEVVLIETEEKRVKWPLGIITEIYEGKDGINRTAQVKTSMGLKVRPFQRLYPMEVSTKEVNSQLQGSSQELTGELFQNNIPPTNEELEMIEDGHGEQRVETDLTTGKKTRSGRAVKIPNGSYRGEVDRLGRGTESASLHELHSTLTPPAAPDHHWQYTLILILKGLIFSTIIFGALFGNALVIISVHRHRKLRVLTNYYVVSLAVADMLVALCAMTFNASSELTDAWMFGPLVCDIFNSLDVYFSSASILHLCCISVDRYYAIVRPLEYPVTMTHRTVCLMLANVWLWPAFISFVPIFMGWYTTEHHRQYRKEHPDVCIFQVNMVYAILSSSVSFWIPSLVMISMYCRIFREAIRQREALTRTSSNILLNSVHLRHTSHSAHHSHYLHPDRRPSDISPNYSTFTEVGPEETEFGGEVMTLGDICPSKEASPRKSVHERLSCDTASSGYFSGGSNKRSSSGLPPSVGWRPSCSSAVATRDLAKAATQLNSQGATLRAAGKSWRAEHKAARTLGIIVGAFLLCWLPFFLWYVTTNVCGEPCETPDVVVGVLFWIGYFNSALNPLIYAYFNRDFRDAFKNTLMCALPCCFRCWKDAGTAQFV